jgi:hypothetical protein
MLLPSVGPSSAPALLVSWFLRICQWGGEGEEACRIVATAAISLPITRLACNVTMRGRRGPEWDC